jgi:hypothetical protein
MIVRSLLKRRWLWDACHSPLMLRFVCLVADELKKLDHISRTKVYKLVVDHFMVRLAGESDVTRQLEVRQKLAEIAWNGYSSRNLLVAVQELAGPLCNDLMRCGLLRAEGTIEGERNMHSWVHFTIQEYLAAEHVCSDRFKGDLVKELQRCLKFQNRNVFFGFVCGVGGNAVECASEWYPRELELYFFGDLKDHGPLIWLEEGGKKLEEVVAKLWKELFGKIGGAMLLRAAAKEGCVNVVKFLIGQKIDVNAVDEYEWEGLFASRTANLEVVQSLNDRVAILNAVLKRYWTALLHAAQSGHLEVLKWLIEHGANVNAADMDGRAALLDASENGHLEVVKWLIERGANVNAIEIGVTALMFASANGHLKVVKWLIERGALLLPGPDKLNAWHIAKLAGRDGIAQVIEAKFRQQSDAENELWKSRATRCTVELMGETNAWQILWECWTCRVYVCFWCKQNCHKGHALEEWGLQNHRCCCRLYGKCSKK